MRDYRATYLRFLALFGAILLGGLLLVSISGAQYRERDRVAEELRIQRKSQELQRSLDSKQNAIRATYGDTNSPKRLAERAAQRKAAEEAKARAQMVQVPTHLSAEVRGTTVSPPKTVTVVLDVDGYNGALQHAIAQELNQLTPMVGGYFEIHALKRDAQGVWEATFLWEPAR